MTAERVIARLANDELRAIALQIETLEEQMVGEADSAVLRAYLTWRLATYYRLETELKETRAKLPTNEETD